MKTHAHAPSERTGQDIACGFGYLEDVSTTASGKRTVLRLTTDEQPHPSVTVMPGSGGPLSSRLPASIANAAITRPHRPVIDGFSSRVDMGDGPLSMQAFQKQAAWQVAAENHAASGLQRADVRWLVAARAAGAVEGGRSAIVRPDRRREIVGLAKELGLKPFDANLVIAIVQDAARHGEPMLGRETRQRVALVRPAKAGDSAGLPLGGIWRAAILIASVAMLVVMGWMMRGGT